MLDENGFKDVKIDWHGHNDRGMAMWNSCIALQSGANRVHGTILGIGERVGNAPLDQILINLKMLGWIDNNLLQLNKYCRLVSRCAGFSIPNNYPVIGKDAFETATGVHASAIVKAIKKGDKWLADRVYSGVPASEFGLEQKIRIGPMSGRTNVYFWLEEHGIQSTEELVDKIFKAAKKSNHLLTDNEINKIIKSSQLPQSPRKK